MMRRTTRAESSDLAAWSTNRVIWVLNWLNSQMPNAATRRLSTTSKPIRQ